MTSEDRLAAHLANLKASLDEPKHKPIGYTMTNRGMILLFATEEEARAAYEDAQSKKHKCELHEDRLIMLEFGTGDKD
ncbi:MAG: hypothetical protein F6K00_19410 [Leptolyngbya sp. SIOISBB]|nr:hypothetical protein [Leptolyngbya sp. SIOISBB]